MWGIGTILHGLLWFLIIIVQGKLRLRLVTSWRARQMMSYQSSTSALSIGSDHLKDALAIGISIYIMAMVCNVTIKSQKGMWYIQIQLLLVKSCDLLPLSLGFFFPFCIAPAARILGCFTDPLLQLAGGNTWRWGVAYTYEWTTTFKTGSWLDEMWQVIKEPQYQNKGEHGPEICLAFSLQRN